MRSIAHRVARTSFVTKTENGIPTVGHGITHRVYCAVFAIKTENGVPTSWDFAHLVKRLILYRKQKRHTHFMGLLIGLSVQIARKRYTYGNTWHCSSG